MTNIHILKGDITTANVDAIVNAANSVMLGGGGVDGAIHKAAGARLLDACKKIESINGIRCPTGEARITEAGNLAARFVIHTAGPEYLFDKSPEKLLACAYENSLELALKNNCLSIAFPAISCGVYAYPFYEASQIAIDVCLQKKYRELQIYFYLYGDDIYQLWQKTLKEKTRTS